MAMKKVPAKNKGLKKLPKAVRNKMGFMKNGGKVKKKKGYKAGGKVKKGYKLGGAIKAIKAINAILQEVRPERHDLAK